jgi:hypothetical protein
MSGNDACLLFNASVREKEKKQTHKDGPLTFQM